MIADFKMHTGAVTSIQFHPMEFLMCSGSSDRTVKFYDLERFQLVSESSPESNAIRKVLFHPDGTALFTGTQESLKVRRELFGWPYKICYFIPLQVHGWEPSKIFDMLPLRWGKVEDMTLSGEQLVRGYLSLLLPPSPPYPSRSRLLPLMQRPMLVYGALLSM